MSANSFGQKFRVTSFGESHGVAVGCIIDGCPSGVDFDKELLNYNLKRRRPGKHDQAVNLQSDREETDSPQVLSGVFEDRSLGTPIAIQVMNVDHRSSDYDAIKKQARAGHADDTWKNKLGHTDHRGGGRSSARETVARVMAGSVAQMFLNQKLPSYAVKVAVSQVAVMKVPAKKMRDFFSGHNSTRRFNDALDKFPSRFPDQDQSSELETLLLEAKQKGHSYGGYIEVAIDGVPPSLGQAVFHKLKADLAFAMLSIPASNSFELGDAQLVNASEGSHTHRADDTEGLIYGGIRGGFTTGERVFFRVGFKPTSSVNKTATSGRHDPCILARAVPVVEAMVHLVFADHLLWQRLDRA